MASTRPPTPERAAGWRVTLAPWIRSLDERISIAVPTLPDRAAIARHLWLRFAVPDQTESTVLQAAGYAERAWLEWFEALELLDLLARVDSAACWKLLLEICDAAETLRRHACPTEFFYGVQPRYELRFAHSFAPSERVEALLRGGPRRPSSPAFSEAKSLLLAALRSARHGDNLSKPLRLSPIRLRFWFALPAHDATPYGNAPTTLYNTTVRFLKRVLALAKELPTAWTPRVGRFFVCAFGFYLPAVDTRDGVRTLIRQIATRIPIFSLTYQRAKWQDRSLFGPFLWTLLPTQTQSMAATTPRALLGLRKLAISSQAARRDEIIALCASIGQSRSLREFSLLDDSSPVWRYDRTWTSCLAFALFHRSATHQIHTVHLKLHRLGVRAMTTLLTEANPATYIAALADGLLDQGYMRPAPPHPSPPSSPPLTKVRVRAHAEVLHRQNSDAYEVKTLSQDAEDVECYIACQDYGEYVRVLAPGVGLCCVHRKDVLGEFPVEEEPSRPVRSLTLRVTGMVDMESIARLLGVVGAPLTELVLINTGLHQEGATCLDALLAACPRLQRLELSRVTLSQNTLVPNGWGHKIESLTLRGCGFVRYKRHPGESARVVAATTFPRLASLLVDARETNHPPAIQKLLAGLAIARNVQRFVVMSNDDETKATYRTLLERVCRREGDRIHALPLRHKLALLSAVSVGGGSERALGTKFVLDADALRLIMEMAAPTVRQRICTFES